MPAARDRARFGRTRAIGMRRATAATATADYDRATRRDSYNGRDGAHATAASAPGVGAATAAVGHADPMAAGPLALHGWA